MSDYEDYELKDPFVSSEFLVLPTNINETHPLPAGYLWKAENDRQWAQIQLARSPKGREFNRAMIIRQTNNKYGIKVEDAQYNTVAQASQLTLDDAINLAYHYFVFWEAM